MRSSLRKFTKLMMLVGFVMLQLSPASVFAHQPNIIKSEDTEVINPEVSKAFYADLSNGSDTYTIKAKDNFVLYVNILVPDIPNQKTNLIVTIMQNNKQIAVLDGTTYKWEKFYEPFGADNYWIGPEYKESKPPGEYKVIVSSPSENVRYSLAIGEQEKFGIKESISAFSDIPKLKRDFFNTSPVTFLKSPLGWLYIIIMYVIAGITLFAYRKVVIIISKNSNRKKKKNIGKNDRLIRIGIGILLLIWAVTTTWSPLLLFFSGFALLEALFSWCGFYAAIGKNTCPQ